MEEELLREWLRIGITRNMTHDSQFFPRDFLKFRRQVNSFDEFLEVFEENKNSDECWSSVFSYWQLMGKYVDTIFLDLDYRGDDNSGRFDYFLEKVFEAVKIFRELFPSVRVYHTGGGGIHVYLDFGYWIQVSNYKKTFVVLRNLDESLLSEVSGVGEKLEMFHKGMDYVLEWLDYQAYGSLNKLSRVVGSLGKRGRRMIKLDTWADDFWSWVMQVREGVTCDADFGTKNNGDWVGKVLLFIEDKIAELREKEIDTLSSKSLSSDVFAGRFKYGIPPCVLNCIESLVENRELDHSGRILLATFMILAGYSDEEIVDVFRPARDFSERYTRYQVKYLREHGYMPYKCRNVMVMGYCPFKCVYYPWMMKGEKHEVRK